MTPLVWLAVPLLAAVAAALLVGPWHRRRERPLSNEERAERLRRALDGRRRVRR